MNISVPQCNSSDSSCVLEAYKNFDSDEFIQVKCLPECPLECNKTNFYTSMSSSNSYPTRFYESYLLANSPIKELYNKSDFSQPLRYNILKLNIYFDSLSYTKIVQVPAINVFTLISNIGGSVGLVLGLNVFTLFEFIELSVTILLLVLKHRKSGSKVINATSVENTSQSERTVDI